SQGDSLLLCVFLFFLGGGRGPAGHGIIRNPLRLVHFDSTQIQHMAIQDLICTYSLSLGLSVRSLVAPLTCDGPVFPTNRCEAQALLWLSLGNQACPKPGDVDRPSACATWSFSSGCIKDCCLSRTPFSLQSYGDFYTY
uniref:Peptidase S1 domain-containing protein n=1 Tax=Paramormyrops kingsleyae TaxID=1676925 RepID=A0A3B3SMK9_9TELE